MRISDWSSDVCSSDLYGEEHIERLRFIRHCRTLDMASDEVRTLLRYRDTPTEDCGDVNALLDEHIHAVEVRVDELMQLKGHLVVLRQKCASRSEAHTSELQSLMRISYAVFSSQKKYTQHII